MEEIIMLEFMSRPDDFEVLVSDCQIILRGCGVTEEFLRPEDHLIGFGEEVESEDQE